MMFWLLLKKELKVFYQSKGNLSIMLFLPLLLLIIFGLALGTYMQTDYGTFEDGAVLYYDAGADRDGMDRFENIRERIIAATGVTFTEVTDYSFAQKQVESSKAYGVVTLQEGGFEYFRSTFNEPEGGQLVRSLFEQLADKDMENEPIQIARTVLAAEPIDSKAYYASASLAFSILFMGLLVGFSVYNEKSLGTIERIQLSRAGVSRMFAAKIVTGALCGLGQFVVVFLFTGLVFHVSWGQKIPWMFLLFALLSLLSAVFGGVVGMLCKSKSMCQSIVLMVAMLSGYLGGSITPLSLLENTPVMHVIVNLSPLYWVNRAVTNLRNDILNESTLYAALVLIGLLLVTVLVGFLSGKKASFHAEAQKEAVTA